MNLYRFQRKGLDRVAGKCNVALYWDMGLGKTFAGFQKMKEFGGRLNLIICQKSKMMDWSEHAGDNVGDLSKVYRVYANESEEFIFSNLNKYIEDGLTVYVIINYELLWRRPAFSRFAWDTIMLDESSVIQNEKTKAAKFILHLSYQHCILLSGTPCSGKYENLWSQAYLLGWDISKSAFDSTYVNWEKFYVGKAVHYRPCKDDPYKNVERLKRKLRENGADFLKTEDVIELPQQMIVPMRISDTYEYLKFKKDRYIEFGDKPVVELIGDSMMSWRIGLKKLCSEYSEYKKDTVVDLLNSSNERFIIFYNYNSELKMLMTLCDELHKPFSIVNGKEKDLITYEKESDSVTLVQYQAGAMGLNLQKAQRIIYFSLPERSDLFEQSKKRIHRLGQKSTCWYYIPITARSIEESIYKALLEKKDYTDELFKEEFENGKVDE